MRRAGIHRAGIVAAEWILLAQQPRDFDLAREGADNVQHLHASKRLALTSS